MCIRDRIKPQHPDTIVIFLTANDQESDQIRGYEVVGCADGASAKEKGLSQSFDIMIIDWMLPEISGIELVRLFRGKGIDSVMMMLTARDEEEDILEAFAAVSYTHLSLHSSKPFPAGRLMSSSTKSNSR